MEKLTVPFYVENTPYRTKRLFMRLPCYAELFDTWRLLIDFTIAPISIWGASDKTHEIKDGSRFVSYEYSLQIEDDHIIIAIERAAVKLNDELARCGKHVEFVKASTLAAKMEVWG